MEIEYSPFWGFALLFFKVILLTITANCYSHIYKYLGENIINSHCKTLKSRKLILNIVCFLNAL